MTARMAACDCPTCPDRGLVVQVADGPNQRCRVCGWLLRILPERQPADQEAER